MDFKQTPNPNLPPNAVRTTDVVKGMRLVYGGQPVKTVKSVSWFGSRGTIVFTDDSRVYVHSAGTMRLAS